MAILLDDKSAYPSKPGAQPIQLDLRLSPAVANRFLFVRWGLFVFGVLCLLVGLVFMSLGAQPVLGFMGLEAVLLYEIWIVRSYIFLREDLLRLFYLLRKEKIK